MMRNDLKKALTMTGVAAALGGACAVIIALFVVGPLLMIFGMNLLGMAVPYTFKTWCGAALLLFVTKADVKSS